MARSKYFLFLLLLIFLQQQPSKSQLFSDEISPALDVLGDTNTIIGFTVKVISLIDKIGKATNNQFHSEYEPTLKLVNKKLDLLSDKLSYFQSSLYEKLDKMDIKYNLEKKMDDLLDKVEDMERYYNRYLKVVTPNNSTLEAEKDDLLNLIITIAKGGLESLLQHMHKVLINTSIGNKASLVELLADKRLESEVMCQVHQSTQQVILNLYRKIVLLEIQGHILNTYATRRQRKKEGWSEERVNEPLPTDEMAKRLQQSFNKVKGVLETASRGLYRCDPEEHNEGSSYARFAPILQGYLINERLTTFERSGRTDSTCWYNCEDKGEIEISYRYIADDLLMTVQRKCLGILRNCKSISRGIDICFSSKEENRQTGRMYEFVKTKEDAYLGRQRHCNTSTFYRRSIQDAAGIGPSCDYCLCECDEGQVRNEDFSYVNTRPNEIRSFSLGYAVSDIRENMVIIGLRFKVEQNVLHIQIQQGKLLPNGTIGEYNWKSTEDEQPHYFKGGGFTSGPLEITHDQRTVCLDDLEPPAPKRINHVLTGIKFQRVKNHLKLRIRLTSFNYETGELDPASVDYQDQPEYDHQQDGWIMNEKLAKHPDRSELILENPDVPIHYKNVPDSGKDQFIYIRTTDKDKDLSQNLVPFIDIQEVVQNPPVPLSGAGLIHKGTRDSGGFLAMKLFTYDLYNYAKNSKSN